jgi:hypothetical protein
MARMPRRKTRGVMTTRLTRNSVRWSALLLAASFSVSTSLGQFTSSTEGTVTDPSNSAVPGATITLLNTETGIKTSVMTDGAGYFVFPSLPAGVFSITASGAGFKMKEVSGLRLESGTRRTVNIVLEVGTQTAVVNVQAEAAAVDLSEAKVAGVIESKQLTDLPVPGRNYMALVALMPGVTGALAASDVFAAQTGVNFNAGGQRSEQNGFAVDSGTVTSMVRHGQINLQPNTESIQEVQVTVNNFSAASGSDAGAQIKVASKAGTNDYHGSASWFHQDNVLSSRSIFQSTVNSANGRSLPAFRRNEVAGSLGGPIKKNRTFLFASFDILRQGTSPTATSTVETPALVSFLQQRIPNNKSTFLFTKYPASFSPYLNLRNAGSVLGTNCASLASPSAEIPSPIGAIPCNMNIIGDGITPIISIRNAKQWSVRGDHMITSNDRLYVNVYRTGEIFTAGGSTTRPQFTYPQQNLNWFGNVNETHTFSSKLLNEFRMSVVRVHGEIECRECQIPTIAVTGLTGFGTGGPTPYLQNNYEWADTLTWIKGGHNVKAGVIVMRLQANWKPTASYQRPGFSFNTLFDLLNDNPFQETNIGFNPTNGSVYTPDAAERQHTEAAFAEDSWKMRPNLTITYGLRWETYGKINQATLGNNVEFRTGNDMTSRIADGKDITKYEILDNQPWHNFAPRLSFAWDPTGKGRTSLRGGFGLFYDFMPSQLYGGAHYTPPIFSIVTASSQTAPLLPLYAFGASGSDPYRFPRPIGLDGIIGLDERNGSSFSRAGITWVDPSLQNTYTESLFFGIQQSLTSTLTVEANYVGNFGRHVYSKYNVNRFPGDLVANNGVLKRLNPSFGAIDYGQANMTAAYNGGNFSLRQRYSHGLLFQAAYTFGHAINQADGFGGGLQVNDWWNLKLEKGTAGYNIAQKLALSAVWQVPSWNTNAVAKKITGGWQLSGVTILQTGNRFSVLCGTPFVAMRDSSGKIVGNSGCDYNADGSNFDRPNAPTFGSTIDMSKNVLLAGALKAADFPKPALGQVGNLGRNMYTNPGYANTDLSLMRNFKLPLFEKGTILQFRAESFNAFNRVNLGGITGDISSVNFGKVTSITGSPRRYQFGLRLSF